jgi:hypothetical protein
MFSAFYLPPLGPIEGKAGGLFWANRNQKDG